MKKIALAFSVLGLASTAAACDDFPKKPGIEYHVKCWSAGTVTYDDTMDGRPAIWPDSDKYTFRENSGNEVTISGPCKITPQSKKSPQGPQNI